jgi:hypothetical protein
MLYKAYDNERLRVGGFLPRCMSVDTKLQALYEEKGRPIEIDPEAMERWAAHIRAQVETFRMSSTPYELAVEPEVYDVSCDFYNRVIDLVRGELNDVASFALRWNEQAWRISLNLHSGEYGVESLKHLLSKQTFESAIRISWCLAQEQVKILHRSRIDAQEKDLRKLQELILRNRGLPIPLRDLKNRHSFTENRIVALLKSFPQMIYVDDVKPKKESKGGRPSRVVGLKRGNDSPADGDSFRIF